MRWLVGAACIVVIAAGCVYLAGQYNAYASRKAADTAELDAFAAKAASKAKMDKELRDFSDAERLNVIGQKGCDQAAIDVLWVATTRPIVRSDDIPDRVRQDIRTCLTHGKVRPDDVAKIKAAGLYDLALN